jgi:(E)-4-hydroxy-3-methylbut-2-enyl-diphosphate synthase
MKIRRRRSRPVRVGAVTIGGGSPVSVQSMTNTPTSDPGATLRQIEALAASGAQIARVAVPDEASAAALREIVERSPLPVVADVHFRADLALAAVRAGVAKLRINPGNIRREREVASLAEAAAARGIPIRIGINSGSIPGDVRKRLGNGPDALWAAAESHLGILEGLGFEDIVLSLKAADPLSTVDANIRAARECRYPLHLGVTEAGPPPGGAVRSAVALSILLSRGIGDTVRVSLSGPPEKEAPVAWEVLSSLGLGRLHPRLVSCPTCARSRLDVAAVAGEIAGVLEGVRGDFTVAVMGCEVNGPGEARDADLALVGTPAGMILFVRGRRAGAFPADEAPSRLRAELERLAEQPGGLD